MRKKLILIEASFLFFVAVLPLSPLTYALSSNQNVYVGINNTECTATGTESLLLFSSDMTTVSASTNQWSAQANSYAGPNNPGGWGFNFMQYMAIDVNGHVYSRSIGIRFTSIGKEHHLQY